MFEIGMASGDWAKLLLILGVAALLYAGPLVYRILRGEKFTGFRDPSDRPGKRQWQALREEADRVIAGDLNLEAQAFQGLIDSMIFEIQIRQYRNNSLEQSEDVRRVQRLTEVFEAKGYRQRIEPFDSLADGLERDGLGGVAQRLRSPVHGGSPPQQQDFRKAFVEALRGIRGEHWEAMRGGTRKRWRECYKLVNSRLLLRAALVIAISVVLAGLSIYEGWVGEGQYKYFRDHPEWLWAFAAYGLLVLTLLVAVVVSYARRRRRHPVDKPEWPVS